MHILYVDDSGHVENPDERYFVLGGVSIFERSIYHLIKAVDDCVAAFGLGPGDDIELHGSPMYSGRGALWRSIRERAHRERMINDALYCLQHNSGVRLFAVAVDKAAVAPRTRFPSHSKSSVIVLTYSCSATTIGRMKRIAG
ncbi:DUF3800 domain-containing protein [Rhizobium sp. 0TCS1.26]|uniref:DUF3800 domain-containing protein n=1 Tax=Rhizobium sp. 0TCS1.26 TaxID=3142623 RepID=UPI003D274EC4